MNSIIASHHTCTLLASSIHSSLGSRGSIHTTYGEQAHAMHRTLAYNSALCRKAIWIPYILRHVYIEYARYSQCFIDKGQASYNYTNHSGTHVHLHTSDALCKKQRYTSLTNHASTGSLGVSLPSINLHN